MVIIFEMFGYCLEEVLVDLELALQVLDRFLIVKYFVGSVNHHLLGAHVGYLQPNSAHLKSEVSGGLLDDWVPLLSPCLALQPTTEALNCPFLERKHLRKELFLGQQLFIEGQGTNATLTPQPLEPVFILILFLNRLFLAVLKLLHLETSFFTSIEGVSLLGEVRQSGPLIFKDVFLFRFVAGGF